MKTSFPQPPQAPPLPQAPQYAPGQQGQMAWNAQPLRQPAPERDKWQQAYRPMGATGDPFRLTVSRSDLYKMSNVNSERFVATSQAAERWRESWRSRQHAEAGPAEKASRGQASVPMPLMMMQQSFLRMRAVGNPAREDARNTNFGFWVTLFLMLCLIGGMGIYIISTFRQPSHSSTAGTAQSSLAAQPSLTIQGAVPTTLAMGQQLRLHGDHFSPNDSIAFLLDTTTPITGTNGGNLTTQTDGNGAFAVVIPIGTDWAAGSHLIEALSNRTSQAAYLTVTVIPAGTPVTTSSNLQLSVQNLAFTATVGRGNPDQQRVTLTNTSGAPLTWTAMALADHNLSWLVINDHDTQGTLAISQTHSMGISVITTGLQSSTKPYTAQILFSINDKELLTLPVQLQIKDAKPELTFSPNPIVVVSRPDGSCQPGASLTLINLGTTVQNWKLGVDGPTGNRLHFLINGQIITTGQLAPSGQSQPGNGLKDTIVLQVQCFGVKPGDNYPLTVYANGASWPELVTIQ